MRWDSWHAQDIDLYATIGQLQKQAGISFGSPERHISRLSNCVPRTTMSALFLNSAAPAKPITSLGPLPGEKQPMTRITYGLALYHAGGIGSAVTNWELVLAEDPSLIYALPYLARGYYDLGRYQAGIDAAERLSKQIKDHDFVLANAYSIAGDCYAKLGMTRWPASITAVHSRSTRF